MRLSVFQRKAILLHQKLFELQLFDHRDSHAKNFHKYIDPKNHQNDSGRLPVLTLREWRHGERPEDTNPHLEAAREILTKKFGMGAARAFTNDDISVDEFCETIQFHKTLAHAVIDAEHQEYRPTFDIFIKSKIEADDFMNEFGGLYYLYRIEQNQSVAEKLLVPPSKKIISRCTLSIRYPIPYKKIDGAFHIRCKICVPAYNFDMENIGVHKLDGLVSDYMPVSKLLYLTLEHRAPPEGTKFSDLMNIQLEHTFVPDSDTGLSYLRGAMSTCSQNHGKHMGGRGRDVFLSSIILIRDWETHVKHILLLEDENKGRYKDFWFLKLGARPDGPPGKPELHDKIPDDQKIIQEDSFMSRGTGLFCPEDADTPDKKLAVRLLREPWNRLQILKDLGTDDDPAGIKARIRRMADRAALNELANECAVRLAQLDEQPDLGTRGVSDQAKKPAPQRGRKPRRKSE
jgi:hypothetical protein